MFRVGDIVERLEINISDFHLAGKQHTVVSINPEGTHISIDNTGYRFLSSFYKLVTPVWKVGDTAKVIACKLDVGRIGNMFIVHRVDDEGMVYEAWNKSWTPTNLERVALAPEHNIFENAGITQSVREDGVREMKIDAGVFRLTVPEDGGPPITLTTILAREMEIPTYLYNLVEVKPRIKPGVVQVGPCIIDIETEETGVVLSNIETSVWNANDLRKLAKLCTDLADLMG